MNLLKCSSVSSLNIVPLITSLLLFALIITACGSQEAKLVNPEHFEKLLPEKIAPGFEKSSFSARTSASENWGGASYMGEGTYFQLGIRHFTQSKWNEEKASSENDNESIEVGDYTGYYNKLGTDGELSVYFGNNFLVRVVGPNLSKEDLTAILKEMPYKKINALASEGDTESKKKE